MCRKDLFERVSFFFSLFVVCGLVALFPARSAMAERPATGTVIDQSNWEKYKDYFAPGVQEQLKRGYLSYVVVEKHKHVDMPNEAWTEKCKGKAKLGPEGELIDYCGAGIPFPDVDVKDPQAARKVAWNFSKRYTGDTLLYSPSNIYLVDKKGNERTFSSEMLVLREQERVVLDPKPVIPGSDIRVRWRLNTTAPFDVKGFATVMIRYQNELLNPDQQWIYIPTLRRVRRMSTGQKGDSWAGSDLTYDDFLVERVLDFNYKLVDFKEMLICGYCDDTCFEETFSKREGFKIFNLPAEFQKIYILEAVSKDPKYHYGKYVYFIDPEYWQVNLKECYDRKMELWKISTLYGCVATGIVGARIGSMMDLQADHCTVWDARKEFYNIDLGAKEFTPERLKELGR